MYVLRKTNGSESNVKKKIIISHFYLFVKKIKIKNKEKREENKSSSFFFLTQV
jgi:hypothetical protein